MTTHKSPDCPMKDWPSLCGICKHFSCDMEEVETKKPNVILEKYVGKGFCGLHEKDTKPTDTCDKFSCQECSDPKR